MSTGQGMSIRGYAAHRKAHGLPGGSPWAVQKALKGGRIEKNGAGKIDAGQADQDWRSNTDPGIVATPPSPAARRTRRQETGGGSNAGKERTGPSYADARAIHEAIRAKMANLDYQEKAGRLGVISEMERTAFELARQVRDSVAGVADRLAPILAAETDQRKIAKLIRDELRAALQGLADRG